MNKVAPRIVPDRDDYYMGLAFFVASKSKDPNTQIGAVIVSGYNEPISTGYNGPPSNIDDELVDWSRPAKYDFVIHAEINSITYAKSNLEGSTLYVTGRPCKNCMLQIVSNKIKRVVYFNLKVAKGSMLADEESWLKSMEIARLGDVKLEEFKGNLNWMGDRIYKMKDLGVLE